MLRQVYAIAAEHDLIVMNVFHAGDGNLHPLIVFDAREPGIWDRVHAAGDAILRACIAAGGVLTGEHGIGLEKRELMPLLFNADDLDAQARLRDAFDPDGRANPRKVLPQGSRCGEASASPRARGSEPGRRRSRESIAAADAVAVVGAGTQREVGGRADRRARPRCARPAGVVGYEPADMTVTVRAGRRSPRSTRRWPSTGRSARSTRATPTATVGGVLACGLSGPPPAALRAAPRPRARGALRHRRRPAREGRRARRSRT